MIADRKFQFRPVLTVCAGVALAILIALGHWQLQRLEWKRELIAGINTAMNNSPQAFADINADAELEYIPVFLEGAFLLSPARRVFGTYDGAPGAYFFAPFEATSGEIVFINRGFVPQGSFDSVAPVGDASIRVEGLLRQRETPLPPASWFRQTGPDAAGFWYVRDPIAFASAMDLKNVAPFYIDQFAVEGAQWPKGGTTRLDFRNKHLEYALTWFGLAGALIGVWFAMSLRPATPGY